uniref:DNA polymerase delta subunit 3 n=1 Tax=Anopheles farauti TaxID=69004 RepID=A0A182QHH7_9DIPT
MDEDLLKTCHSEIGHIVFDTNEKVTTRRISNNWNLSSQQSLEVLQKWTEQQKGKKELSLEYIVRGIDKSGNVFITLANEVKMEQICKLFPKSSKMLYSVEIASDVRPLNVSNDNEFSTINLRLDAQKRKMESIASVQITPQAPPVKQETQPKKSNMFSMTNKAPVKQEKHSPPPMQPQVKEEPKSTISPKKTSPKTQSPKKDAKKAATGKGSISSFFSSKPGQTTAAPKTVPVKQEPQSPAPSAPVAAVKEESKESSVKSVSSTKQAENARKRTITDDEATEDDEEVIPSTPQEDKKRTDSKKRPIAKKPLLQQKKKSLNPAKKSRILEICDSSSEEELDGREAAEQRDERLVQFDEEMPEEPAAVEKENARKSLSPEKPVENDASRVNRNRGKVKKLVTKTYTDDDGYLITVKDYEMVSEDEEPANGVSEKEMAAPAVKAKAASNLGSQGKSSSIDKKKETPPTPKTKQGSIMSFFAKK